MNYDDYASLREFLITELSFTGIKTSGVHTLWAPLELWQVSQHRMDQPLLLRVNTAPGGKDLEVTVLLANVPMVKISPEDVRHIDLPIVREWIAQGRRLLQLLAAERAKFAHHVRVDHALHQTIEVNA